MFYAKDWRQTNSESDFGGEGGGGVRGSGRFAATGICDPVWQRRRNETHPATSQGPQMWPWWRMMLNWTVPC